MLRSVLASAALTATLAGCGGGKADKAPTQPAGNNTPASPAAPPVVSAISIDAPSSTVVVGGSVKLTAVPRDKNGVPVATTVSWTSMSPTVATVDNAGLVTGGESGTATIRAVASTNATTTSVDIAIYVVPPWTGPAPPRNVMVNNPGRSSFPNVAQKEPSVGVFGSRVVVGWNDQGITLGQTVRGVASSVGFGYSTDGGATFIDAGELGNSQWGADPTVAVDRAGHFFLARMDLMYGGGAAASSSSPDRVAVFRSLDGGISFPQSASLTGNSGGVFNGVNDKPTITTDNTGGRFDGNVYASWTFANSNVLTIRFARSTDGGTSFSPPIALSTGSKDQMSMPAVGANGEVYVAWADNSARELLVRKSDDGGVSFGAPVRVAAFSPIGDVESETAQYCGRVLKGSLRAGVSATDYMIAVDRSGGSSNGAVYVAFDNHGAGTDAADVFLTTSRDGGATWSAPSRLNDDATTNDQWLPFVAVAPNGTVAVSWYDRRRDPDNLLIDVFMRISPAGGASFGPDLKISEVSFPPPQVNRSLGFPPYTCYFSSYNWIAADASAFYLVWTDNRMVTAGIPDSNIFFARIPY